MTRREYERELARLIPAFAAEVQALYAELIGTARRRVEAAISTGNADEVIRLLGLGEDQADATFGILLESLRDVFILGGAAQAARLHLAAQLRYDARGTRAVQDIRLRFDARNERAVEYLRQNDQGFAEGLSASARERVRQVIADGVQRGLTPAPDRPTHAAAGANRDSGRIVGQGTAGAWRPFDTAQRGLSAAQGP